MFGFIVNRPTFFGGNFTYGDLAEKFGWPAVIISTLTYPVLLAFGKLLAYPIWLPIEPKMISNSFFSYPGHDDLYRKRFYTSLESLPTFPPAWNAVVDDSMFYECFWGIFINCLNCEVNEHYYKLTTHPLSWIHGTVFVEFSEAEKVYGHRLRFYIYSGGLNAYNPINMIVGLFLFGSIKFFTSHSMKPFMTENGVQVHKMELTELPEKDLRPDGSSPFPPSLFDILNKSKDESSPLLAA